MQQGTKEWYQKRNTIITASKVGAILNIAPFSNRAKTLDDMINPKEPTTNPALEYGIFHEKLAKVDFQLQTGLTIEDAPLTISKQSSWLGASPDGFVSDGRLIEIKCPYKLRNGGIFQPLIKQPYYYAQVQVQLFCTGYQEAYFFQWEANSNKLEIVKYSDSYMKQILPKLEAFYYDYLKAVNIDDLLQKYSSNKEQIKQLEDDNKKLLENMLEKTNFNSYTSPNGSVYKIEKKGTINYKKIVADNLPDICLNDYRGEALTTWGIKLKKDK